jgi:hypothetical protein
MEVAGQLERLRLNPSHRALASRTRAAASRKPPSRGSALAQRQPAGLERSDYSAGSTGRMPSELNVTVCDWPCSWQTRASPPFWADVSLVQVRTLVAQIWAFGALVGVAAHRSVL